MSFDEGKHSLQSGKQSFDSEKQSFDSEKQSFDSGKQSFDSEKQSFDSGKQSSGTENSSIDSRISDIDVKQPSAEEEYPHEVLSTEEIVEHMAAVIKDANSVVELPAATTRILLNHFKWDQDKLTDQYFDGDKDAFFRDARVVNPSKKPKPSKEKVLPTLKRSHRVTEVTEDCKICLTVIPSHIMTGLECGHNFCENCWAEYLRIQIMDEGVGETIKCPAHGCEILVDDETVMRLVHDPKIWLKYQQLITRSFVECNRLLKWCPSPGCDYAIKVQYVKARPVTCRCAHTFCFQCTQNWHDPVKCDMLKMWIKKCNDDSETYNWIAANTKECPKCNVAIDKYTGCNHVTCNNKGCRYEFCWVCLGQWEPHGSSWYNCNRYDEEETKAARDAQEISRAALKRYNFYCDRFMNHMNSQKLEKKLYQAVKSKMGEMRQHNMSWVEVQFLKKAVDILCQCRQTLMYTYVFAYYLRKNNQSAIFEDNQRDLESATETLSELLEKEIIVDNFKKIVQDKSIYCDGRRKILLEHVHEGYENGSWDFTSQ